MRKFHLTLQATKKKGNKLRIHNTVWYFQTSSICDCFRQEQTVFRLICAIIRVSDNGSGDSGGVMAQSGSRALWWWLQW